MEVVIRKATIEDLPKVQELSQELFYSDLPNDPLLNEQWTYQKEGEEYFTKRLSQKEGICFVAESQGKIIGYATANNMPILAWRPVKRVEMENLIITKDVRGQKIGEKLAEAVYIWAQKQGVQRVMVAAYAANDGAIKFYKRVGFVPDSLQLEKEV